MKIATIICVSITLLIVITTSIGLIILNKTSENILHSNIAATLETTAQTKAEHIATILDHYKADTEQIASSPQVRSLLLSDEKTTSYMEKMETAEKELKSKVQTENLLKITVFDKNGRILISTDQVHNETYEEIERLVTLGENYFKGPHFSNIFGKTCIHFGFPIKNNGETIGFVITDLNTAEIEKVTLDNTGLGNSGETYLVTLDSMLLTPKRYNTKKAFESKITTKNSELCITKDALGDHTSHPDAIAFNADGQELLGTHRYIPNAEWCLIAEISKDEAITSSLRTIIITRTALMAITSTLIILLSIMLTKLIVTPLDRISENMDDISQGRFDIELKKSRIYEVNRLVNSLNRVIISLKLCLENRGNNIYPSLKIQELLASMEHALFMVNNKTGMILECNLTAEKLTGYTKQELHALSFYDLFNPKIKKTINSQLTINSNMTTKDKKTLTMTIIPISVNINKENYNLIICQKALRSNDKSVKQ